jgi:hypothetical protein
VLYIQYAISTAASAEVISTVAVISSTAFAEVISSAASVEVISTVAVISTAASAEVISSAAYAEVISSLQPPPNQLENNLTSTLMPAVLSRTTETQPE